MTLDLFPDAPAVARGVAAAHAAAGKADDLDPGWSDAAVEAVRRFARTTESAFTIEVAREYCPAIPEGADARAWGVVTRIAMERGFIRFAGHFLPAASSHGSMKPTYERGDRCDCQLSAVEGAA